MNKVFLLSPDEDWIVDRFVKEWNDDNADVSVSDPREADVIWLLADWCWTRLPMSFLRTKKVITSVHHIVPEKFGKQQVEEFLVRDSITTAYHVYNSQTEDFVKKLSNKPVHLIKYWANQKVWRKTGDKLDLRRKLGLPIEGYLVGSFQRDTEGHDLRSPKLEKGPDLLCDYLEKIKSESLHVVLAGWRRQYVMSRLKESQIPYTYFERPSHETVNELYQCLDLYPVAARCEGGPQSLIECGLLDVPVVSRDVGIASQVLSRESISRDLVDALPSVPDVESWKLPRGYEGYRRLIQEV
jgi:hypothetical protein